SSVAAGIRRIEARTGQGALHFMEDQLAELEEIRQMFRSSGNLKGQIENLKRENDKLKQELVAFQQIQSQAIKAQLLEQAVSLDDFHLVSGKVMDLDADQLKNLTYELGDQLKPAVVVLGNASSDKAQL